MLPSKNIKHAFFKTKILEQCFKTFNSKSNLNIFFNEPIALEILMLFKAFKIFKA